MLNGKLLSANEIFDKAMKTMAPLSSQESCARELASIFSFHLYKMAMMDAGIALDERKILYYAILEDLQAYGFGVGFEVADEAAQRIAKECMKVTTDARAVTPIVNGAIRHAMAFCFGWQNDAILSQIVCGILAMAAHNRFANAK